MAGAKTAVKKTIPSFYAAITHQDTGTFNQHQHSRDDSQLIICPRIKYYTVCAAQSAHSLGRDVSMCCLHISPFVHFPRAAALDTGLRAQGWRMEIRNGERETLKSVLLGERAAWAREHKMDWTQEMLNSDV